NLAGAATTEASVFANLFSSDELAPEVPQNPASFQAIGQAANFVSSLTVYDSLGVGHDLTVAFYKTDTNTWTVQAYANGDEVGGEQGTPVAIGPDVVLNFSPDGTIAEADQAGAQLTASPPWSGGAAAGEFAI